MYKLHLLRITSLLGGFILFSALHLSAQSLPFDFESTITTASFVDFDGGTATVLANPYSTSDNPSAKVAQLVRNGGQVWAGSKIELAQNLDFSTANVLEMKVYTTAPAGTVVKFKLESGSSSTERDVVTTVSNQWEVLRWDFTGTPSSFNTVVFMFDFGNVGNGSAASTFYFDDVVQIDGGIQLDLPVDFQGTTVNYALTDFGGTSSSLVADPEDATNTVARTIKTNQAETWAGTTIGTNAGFATYLPLSLSASKMNVRVWSPTAGTPVRLKVEDANDATHTCETQVLTTVAGAWEVLTFDFTNEAPGTESLSVGLSMGWRYNMASIFFNFGTAGSAAGEQTYYFDDVKFGAPSSSVRNLATSAFEVYPNPTSADFFINSVEGLDIEQILVFDVQGRLMLSQKPASNQPQLSSHGMPAGTYTVEIRTSNGIVRIPLVKLSH